MQTLVLQLSAPAAVRCFLWLMVRLPMQKQQQNEFALKTDIGSAELYFHYYGMLMHQQNMLQDQIRTGTYYAAILENPADFQGKVVMDVGAGSGILSLFAAQVL